MRRWLKPEITCPNRKIVNTPMAMDNSVFVHPQGLCESEDIGPRTRVWAFAHVMKNAKVGADCNIGGGAFIEAGAILGNSVTVKNNVLVWHKVIVQD